jgi:hypothetical protein
MKLGARVTLSRRNTAITVYTVLTTSKGDKGGFSEYVIFNKYEGVTMKMSQVCYILTLISGIGGIVLAAWLAFLGHSDTTVFGIGRSDGILWILGWLIAAIWYGMGAFWYSMKEKGII